MKIQKSFLLLVLILLYLITNAKNSNNSNNSLLTKDSVSLKNAVILDEINSLRFYQEKYDVFLEVTKSLKIKILSKNGVEKFSTIILPENLDPTYLKHSPSAIYKPDFLLDVTILNFSVIILDANNKIKTPVLKNKITNDSVFLKEDGTKYQENRAFIYSISNLEVGDIVTIDYMYKLPYLNAQNLTQQDMFDLNNRNVTLETNYGRLGSLRLFFNSDIFKENYKLTISIPKDYNIEIFYKNNGNVDSIVEIKNERLYYWTKQNLIGCINEKGSRPYISLPHIIFNLKNLRMQYRITFDRNSEYFPTYSIFAQNSGCIFYMPISSGAKSKFTNEKNSEFDKFIEETIKDINNDSLGYKKIFKIQNTITDDFSYIDESKTTLFGSKQHESYSSDYLTNYVEKVGVSILDKMDFYNSGNQLYGIKIQDDLKRKIIRDYTSYPLISQLIASQKLNIYVAYVCDIRSGEIGNEYFRPMFDTDPLIAVLLKNNAVHYIYPKKSQFGYYLNELPFYFENSNTRLVHMLDIFEMGKYINEKPRIVKLPTSVIKENVRMNNVSVILNIDSMFVKFNARINLSGQYSTMTRGLYQFDYTDATINPLYHKKIWELDSTVDLKSKSISVVNKEFPFNAVVNAQYQVDEILSKSGDTISLNLKNWFNHIIYPDMETNNRQLDFYTDFLGKDTYTYYIQFDKNVKLASTFDPVKINNELGELNISLEQINSNTYRLTSYFATISDKVTKEKIQSVKDIYDKIQALNSGTLKFVVE